MKDHILSILDVKFWESTKRLQSRIKHLTRYRVPVPFDELVKTLETLGQEGLVESKPYGHGTQWRLKALK